MALRALAQETRFLGLPRTQFPTSPAATTRRSLPALGFCTWKAATTAATTCISKATTRTKGDNACKCHYHSFSPFLNEHVALPLNTHPTHTHTKKKHKKQRQLRMRKGLHPSGVSFHRAKDNARRTGALDSTSEVPRTLKVSYNTKILFASHLLLLAFQGEEQVALQTPTRGCPRKDLKSWPAHPV